VAKDQVRGPWSLGALGLDEAAASALCDWYEHVHETHVRQLLGSFSAADVAGPSTYGKLALSNEAAFGSLALALVARARSRPRPRELGGRKHRKRSTEGGSDGAVVPPADGGDDGH
jgi:hypothetical protein